MRTFVALPLPQAIRDQVEQLQDGLRAGRAVAWDNLHLTLAFLDDQPLDRLEALHEELERLRPAPFDLRLAGLEVYGEKKPSAVVLRAEGGAALVALQAGVMRAARMAGMDLPRRRFRPHVTIARFNAGSRGTEDAARIGAFLQARGDWATAPFEIDAYCLYASHLMRDGPWYEEIGRYELAPSGVF